MRILGILLNPAIILAFVLLGTGGALVFFSEKGIESVDLSRMTGSGLGSRRPVPPATESFLEQRLSGENDSPPPGIRLVDATRESGLTFAHVQSGMTLTSLNEVIGPGACVADYDRDGFSDIYAVNGSGFANYYGKRWWWSDPPDNALYRNKGDGTFEDVARRAGVAHQGFGMGCAFGDYDNDGYPDLYVTNDGPNVLYHNNGDGTFTDVTEAAGVGDGRWGTAIVWFDYDNNGDLDLYVVNYVAFDKGMTPAEPNSAFKAVQPFLMNSALFDSEANVLFRNNGDGTFTDVTAAAGVANSPGRGMGAAALDYDNDGDQDLYIANDESRNVLFRNNGDGTFAEAGGAMGVDSPLSGMGVSAGDYDNDGDMDIFFTSTQAETNVLYRNLLIHDGRTYSGRKDGFVDTTVDAGLGEDVGVGSFGWSAEFLDMDNDGHLDIFVNNGHGMADFDNPQATVGQRNQVFRNNGDGTFSDVSGQMGGAMRAADSGRGAAFGDFDNDGDWDVFVVNNNGPARYLQNQNETSHHGLLISLKGVRSNRDGVGAKVIIRNGNTRQIREARRGSGYLSQMDPRIHFGLGTAARIDEMEVVWPSGIRQKFKDLAGDQWITITEGQPDIAVAPLQKTASRVRALSHSPESADGLGVLLDGISDADAGIRREAAFALGELFAREDRILRGSMLKKREAVTALIKAAEDADPGVRKWSARALGLSESYRAVIPVRDLFRDEYPQVRLEAVRAAGLLRDKRALEALLHVLNDGRETATVRAAAVSALQRLGSDAAVESMRQKVIRGSREERMAVVEMLRSLLENGEAVLMKKADILSLLDLMPADDAAMLRRMIEAGESPDEKAADHPGRTSRE